MTSSPNRHAPHFSSLIRSCKILPIFLSYPYSRCNRLNWSCSSLERMMCDPVSVAVHQLAIHTKIGVKGL